jgi:hypothetical protein
MKIDGNHMRDPSYHRIATGKAATIPSAISYGDDPLRVRSRMIGALQRVAHVLRHRPGYHQHIGMARRRDEPQTKALDVVVGIVQRVDFKFASVARSSVDLAYRETSAKALPRSAAKGCSELGHRGVVRRRRPFGEGLVKQAFEKQLAHLMPPLEIVARIGTIERLVAERKVRNDIALDCCL